MTFCIGLVFCVLFVAFFSAFNLMNTWKLRIVLVGSRLFFPRCFVQGTLEKVQGDFQRQDLTKLFGCEPLLCSMVLYIKSILEKKNQTKPSLF